jgi:predicted deacylase
VVGKRDGPTLGITATVHGDETLPAYALRQLVGKIDTSAMSGRLVVIPIANPMAFNAFGRQSPELHGATDLFEVFPGKRSGNITQRIASIIAEQLIDLVDVYIDIHSGGAGGRIQYRLEYDPAAHADVQTASINLCRAFGIGVVHENGHRGSPVHYANGRGIPAILAELGGPWLGPDMANPMIDDIQQGLSNVMASIGMLPQSLAIAPKKQLVIPKSARTDIDPAGGGYLVSCFERFADLGTLLQAKTKLGELIDLYSFQTIQQLSVPEDSYLFFSRYSGQVEVGNKGFALARASAVKWFE